MAFAPLPDDLSNRIKQRRQDYGLLKVGQPSANNQRRNHLGATLNARSALSQEDSIPLVGGGHLKIKLPQGAKKNVLSDDLTKAIDEAMAQNPNLKGRRVALKNDDPKAKLNRTFKTPLQISGYTPNKLPDHGVSDIQFHNASGMLPTSKHGEARITATGNNDFSNTKLSAGSVNLVKAQDGTKINNAQITGGFSGELAANMGNSTIASNRGVHAAGVNVGLDNSSLYGKLSASLNGIMEAVDSEVHTPGKPMAKTWDSKADLMAAHRPQLPEHNVAALHRPNHDFSAFQGSVRRNKMELAA